MKAKCQHLRDCFNLDFKVGLYEYEVFCEFCRKGIVSQIRTSKMLNPCILNSGGYFHHRNGDRKDNIPDNLIFLCGTCHKRFHELGVVLRWLEELGKKVEDVPTPRSLKQIRHTEWG